MNFEPTTIFGCVVSILNIIMYYIAKNSSYKSF